ncbi:MAG TPA: ketoacyl-ACP synthase III [Candidatus Pullichristensenella avicola]|nr:ketoacyl-ACP synthase III [Candidatus Pullichristensenella avicola]
MRILGTGSALPAHTVTNDDLARFLDTSDEWIRTHTGIRSRQVITDETLLQLARRAAEAALENAGLSAADMDYILCSSVLPDTITPSLGCVLQAEIGAHCPALDVNGACAGFLYALDLADALIASGKAGRVLVVCAEGMTRMVDWTDRSTCVLFGDGAGAAVVDGGEGLLATHLTSQGDAAHLNMYPDPGNSPFAARRVPARALHMDGPEIYKFAVSHSVSDLRAVCEKAGVALEEIDHFLLHQANKRIIDAARARLKQPAEKFPMNVEARGNTSSASVPILLDEIHRAGLLRAGELLAMSAFGAGLTTGACVLRWTKE